MTRAKALSFVPKAELHLHIEGTLEPEMVFAFAARNNVGLPFDTVDELRAAYRFDDLSSFLALYYRCMSVLQTADDFADLCSAYLRRAAAEGVRHVEMFFDPQAHTIRGIPIETVIDGLSRGFDVVRDEVDISGGLILCFLRDMPLGHALETLESAVPRLHKLIGVGLDSAESGYPPSLFSEVFDRAGQLGLHRVAHAGEEGPAHYITEALELLHGERIDHGVRALEDPAVVEVLRSRSIPLTVCPLSNLKLGGVATLKEHPLRDLIACGLTVTVNSDDPAYFGGYIAENYAQMIDIFDLTLAEVARLAENSVNGSFASTARKMQLLAEISVWADNLA